MNRLQIVTIDAYKVLKRLTPNVKITSENVFKIVQEHGLCGVADLTLLPENARREMSRICTSSHGLQSVTLGSRIPDCRSVLQRRHSRIVSERHCAGSYAVFTGDATLYRHRHLDTDGSGACGARHTDQARDTRWNPVSPAWWHYRSGCTVKNWPGYLYEWIYMSKAATDPHCVNACGLPTAGTNRQTLCARRHVMGLSMADNILYACLHRSGHHGHENDKGIWLLGYPPVMAIRHGGRTSFMHCCCPKRRASAPFYITVLKPPKYLASCLKNHCENRYWRMALRTESFTDCCATIAGSGAGT